MFAIDIYTLIGVIVVAVLLFVVLIYYIKRKFDSIDKYNQFKSDKSNSYKNNQEQYNKNMEDAGIKNKKIGNVIFKIIKIIRGSK